MRKLIAIPGGAGTPIFGLGNRLATVVTRETREHEQCAAAEHAWRVTQLVSPRDRAFGLGKWSQKVAHNTARDTD